MRRKPIVAVIASRSTKRDAPARPLGLRPHGIDNRCTGLAGAPFGAPTRLHGLSWRPCSCPGNHRDTLYVGFNRYFVTICAFDRQAILASPPCFGLADVGTLQHLELRVFRDQPFGADVG